MFRKKNARAGLAIDTLVSGATRICGDVLFSGGLHLDGQVAGSVKATEGAASRLVISRGAVVEGTVVADVVEVQGTVLGDIVASGRVVLGAAATVEGDLQYGTLEMAAGARINGKLAQIGAGAHGVVE